jgi:hypothetical protein
MLYKKDESGRMVKEKKRTPDEFINTFGWSQKLDRELPDSNMCFPSIEAYEQVGPLPKDDVVRKIKARKRSAAIRERVSDDIDNITPPTEDGLYLVTNRFELVQVPAKGEKIKFPQEIAATDMPDRFHEIYSSSDESTSVWCVRHQETDLVSVKADDLYGIYLRNGQGFPSLTFDDEALTPHCQNAGYTNAGYNDYVESSVGFGWSARRDNDTLVWMNDRSQPGDVFAVDVDKRQSYEETKVGLFLVE